MKKFDWVFDTQNYLPNNSGGKLACKLPLKQFVKVIACQLDSYRELDWRTVVNLPNHHACIDLSRKSSGDAKKLAKHLEEVNKKAGENESVQIEPFQIKIKGFDNKREYRAYGYNKNHKFHLIYLDPDHDVYKE